MVKKRTYRNRICANDTFDLKYTQTRGPTSKYFVLIEKQMCVAFNLEMTSAGKFDHKSRQGSHAGSTSKEVAELVIREFYRQSACERKLQCWDNWQKKKAFAHNIIENVSKEPWNGLFLCINSPWQMHCFVLAPFYFIINIIYLFIYLFFGRLLSFWGIYANQYVARNTIHNTVEYL